MHVVMNRSDWQEMLFAQLQRYDAMHAKVVCIAYPLFSLFHLFGCISFFLLGLYCILSYMHATTDVSRKVNLVLLLMKGIIRHTEGKMFLGWYLHDIFDTA